MKKRILSIMLMLCMVLTLVPTTVFAEGETSSTPSVSAYATKEQLMNAFIPATDGTAENYGKLIFGKNSEGKSQEWYILGKDTGVSGDNTIIFAASPIAAGQMFEHDWNNKTDSSLWSDCDYNGVSITTVCPNHYGASDLRVALKSMATNRSYFTSAEQGLMNDTTVTTKDLDNGLIYTTTDKLYALHGALNVTKIYAGSSDQIALAMNSYCSSGDGFWLRSPVNIFGSDALLADPVIFVSRDDVFKGHAVQPASNLNLSSVLFASAATAASSDTVKSGTIQTGTAMTLRLDGSSKNIGEVIYNNIADCIIAVKGSTESDVALVVQGNDGTNDWSYSKQITGTNTEIVTVSDIKSALGLSSDIDLSNCKIWLETTDENGMIYAVDIPTRLMGDINGDGVIDIKDAICIQKYLAGLIEIDDLFLVLSDINCDGIVNIADCTMLLKYINDVDVVADSEKKEGISSNTVTSREGIEDTLKVNATSNYFQTVSTTVNKDEEYVTVTYFINSSKDILDTQWTLTYDPAFLEFDKSVNTDSAKGSINLMPMVDNLAWNNMKDGDYNRIKANATKLELYKFADKGFVPFVTATFKILKKGETEVNLNVENLTLSLTDDDMTNPNEEEAVIVNAKINDTVAQPERIVIPHAGLYDPQFPGHNLEKISGKEATYTEEGYKDYWQCQYCYKYFSDAEGNNQITDLEAWKTGEGKIDKLPPDIIKGTGQSIIAGEKKALSFTSNAAYSDFDHVELDGKTLDEKNYTVKEGSTIVTLDADFVSNLAIGEHTIAIVSRSGTASTTFTVNAKVIVDNHPTETKDNNKVTETDDDYQIALWVAVFLISGILLYSQKRKYNC